MVELKDIQDAAERLSSIIVRTPLISSPVLDELTGGRVLLKAENLQRTGSFKIRGAYNLLSQLTPGQAEKGVVAFSSGNHAQAVAAAGTMLGIDTTIVMPEDSPKIKIENTRKLGGTTVLYDRYTEDREEIAKAIVEERGCALVPPYNHEHIVAGQGTAGLEIFEQCQEAGVSPDQVLVSCSGGGLTAGCAIAIKSFSPDTRLYAVEPEDFDDTRRSLQSGELETNDPSARTICDSLMSSPPGEITFEKAVRFAFRNLKLVVEPDGAASLAAILAGKIETRGKVTVAILSGGNTDAETFASIQKGG
jgi:threonine dehydratase